MSPLYLYINSLLHFSREKIIKKDEQEYTIRFYFLDKRFVRQTTAEYLEAILNGTKIKDLDEYYYQIASLQYLNSQNTYYLLDRYNLIISLEEFITMIERS